MQFWNELEGRTIDGRYPLRRLVRSEGRRAWFETEAAPGSPATISLTEALTDADEVTARLQAAQSIYHPNLVGILNVGQVQLDNTTLVYAVMEHIEQSLSDVLQMQALTADESREVAEALIGALTAIHQKGLSHGHVEAASVLATEETVKLRSDCLQTSASGQADDVAGIGATVFHAFTQRKALSGTDAQINRIPAPFAEIVRNSFSRRWNLAQIANALKPGQPSPTAPISPASTSPTPGPTPGPTTSAPPQAHPPAPAQAPLQFESPVAVPAAVKPAPAAYRPPAAAPTPPATPPPAVTAAPPPIATQRGPKALYAAVAVVLLAIVAWLFWPKSAQAPSRARHQATAATAATAAMPAAHTSPAPVATKPSAAQPGAHTAKPTPIPTAAGASGRSVWRVVVYTYRGQTKAADAVSQIGSKHADLKISVFNPAGSSVYMVVVGGAMDRSQATQMLDKARREGLPADTYIRNFSE